MIEWTWCEESAGTCARKDAVEKRNASLKWASLATRLAGGFLGARERSIYRIKEDGLEPIGDGGEAGRT